MGYKTLSMPGVKLAADAAKKANSAIERMEYHESIQGTPLEGVSIKQVILLRDKAAKLNLTNESNHIVIGAEKNIAAFTPIGTDEIYYGMNFLLGGSYSMIDYVKFHENVHLLTNHLEENLPKYLSPYEIQSLNKICGGINIEMEKVFEGFTDKHTADTKNNGSVRSGYKAEVNIATALEIYGREHLGISIMESFLSGNEKSFHNAFKIIADHKLMMEAFENISLTKEDREFYKESFEKTIKIRLGRNIQSIQSKHQAQSISENIMNEIFKMEEELSNQIQLEQALLKLSNY